MPGVSQKVLVQSLREMELHGIVRREVFAEVPPRVEYRLTDKGRDLIPILKSMATWGNKYSPKAK